MRFRLRRMKVCTGGGGRLLAILFAALPSLLLILQISVSLQFSATQSCLSKESFFFNRLNQNLKEKFVAT
jgi:hypothetical protein